MKKTVLENPDYQFSVTVQAQYLPDHSDPEKGHFVFVYFIIIKNTGNKSGQLISRHWIITDANQQVEEVRGLGVIGQQPLLKPGEQFQYNSSAALATPHGSMRGEYYCMGENGAPFTTIIPEFLLSIPRTLH